MNAQDPLSSVHYYLVMMYVGLPGVFGIRMCLDCPQCNCDKHDPLRARLSIGCDDLRARLSTGCQDCMGRNTKPLGGFAGLGEALAFGTELQGDGTLHGHGFIVLVNAWQHSSLQDIANRIDKYAASLSAEDAMSRLTSFMTHVSQEEHFDDDLHQASLVPLEEQFKRNNEGPNENIFLSCRPRFFYEQSQLPSLWDRKVNDIDELLKRVQTEAAEFKKQYKADVQFIFSRVQHHWHPKNKKGKREAPSYCRTKGKSCLQCKRGFPIKVLCDKFNKPRPEKYRVRIVCKGVAAELNLAVSGRRNMLGSVLGKRRCGWFAPTAAILSHVTRSNTNVQTNYRMPLTAHTHDRDCQRKDCMATEENKKILRLCQRAMSQMSGYFGGYISKKQKVGQFELKKSIETLPLLKEKLEGRQLNASSQLAHVCNRFFSVLESKGMLRPATEEFLLASRYSPDDELHAEFIRSFRHQRFWGMAYLQQYDQAKAKKKSDARFLKIPATKTISAEFDEALLYGLRPTDDRLDALCPWVFIQWWKPHRLQSPSRDYNLTVWSDDWEPHSGKRPVAGKDFFLNETSIHSCPHWVCFPDRECFKDNLDYQSFRHSWILIERTYPVVPCAEKTPLPNRKQSKQMRAKLFSVYLRPWTLVATEATDIRLSEYTGNYIHRPARVSE